MARTKTTTRPANAGKAPRKSAVEKGTKKVSKKEGATDAQKERKPHRWRSGTVALREIKRYQKSTELLLRKLPFQRLVREVTAAHNAEMRFQSGAIAALQESLEAYMTELFDKANTAAIHANRVTVGCADLETACAIRGDTF